MANLEDAPSYLAFGDARPGPEDLHAMLRNRPDTSQLTYPWLRRLNFKFLKSEIYLDLAVADSSRAEQWLGSSADVLCDIIDSRRALQRKGRTLYSRAVAPIIFASQLRQTELLNWENAIQGRPLHSDYASILETAHQGLLYVAPEEERDNDVWSKLLEYMPILLGARRAQRFVGTGWLGRLGLMREEKREPLPAATINPNWDTGIILEDDPSKTFLKPTIRLAVKSGFRSRGLRPKDIRQRRSSYVNAGVIPISAKVIGFDDPRQIILSCMNEIEPLQAPEITLLQPRQLDGIGDRLKGNFNSIPHNDQLLDYPE